MRLKINWTKIDKKFQQVAGKELEYVKVKRTQSCRMSENDYGGYISIIFGVEFLSITVVLVQSRKYSTI